MNAQQQYQIEMQKKLESLYKDFLNHLLLVDSVDRIVAWTTVSLFVEAYHQMAFGSDFEEALESFFENIKDNIEFQKKNKADVSSLSVNLSKISIEKN